MENSSCARITIIILENMKQLVGILKLLLIEKFVRVLLRAWKMYLPVHAVPILIFKFKLLKKQ